MMDESGDSVRAGRRLQPWPLGVPTENDRDADSAERFETPWISSARARSRIGSLAGSRCLRRGACFEERLSHANP
jgi:hypothetical protein